MMRASARAELYHTGVDSPPWFEIRHLVAIIPSSTSVMSKTGCVRSVFDHRPRAGSPELLRAILRSVGDACRRAASDPMNEPLHPVQIEGFRRMTPAQKLHYAGT